MRKILLSLLTVLFVLSGCYNREKIVDKSKLNGFDFRLYQQTPVWELAKAVDDEDIHRIKYLIEEEKLPIDYKEEKFGQTLLMTAILVDKYKSAEALLELGANVNEYDSTNGSSTIILASKYGTKDDGRFIRLLLKYGANSNDEEVGPRIEGNLTRQFPLYAASRKSLAKVKALVEGGADVNKTSETFKQGSILAAIFQGRMDIVLYLLQNGADYTMINEARSDGGRTDILYWLRVNRYPLNSRSYKQKMAVVDFLREKGLDYRNSPIPDYVLEKIKKEYPDDWEEYIKVY